MFQAKKNRKIHLAPKRPRKENQYIYLSRESSLIIVSTEQGNQIRPAIRQQKLETTFTTTGRGKIDSGNLFFEKWMARSTIIYQLLMNKLFASRKREKCQ